MTLCISPEVVVVTLHKKPVGTFEQLTEDEYLGKGDHSAAEWWSPLFPVELFIPLSFSVIIVRSLTVLQLNKNALKIIIMK